jgi:protein-tyrosine phosphatase
VNHSPKIIIPNANLRDLGGKKTQTGLRVKTGYLFRSGHLSDLEEEDFNHFKNLQLKTIIDLRRPSEIEKYQTPSLEKVKTLNLSVSSDDNEFAIAANFLNGEQLPTEITGKIIEKYFKNSVTVKLDSYIPVFESLTNPDNFPLLFHCVAGKDRTGIVSAFLLGILDIDESVIIEDYLLTNKLREKEMQLKEKQIRDHLVKTTENNSEKLIEERMEIAQSLLYAKENFITSVFDEVRKSFGTWDNFRLKGLKIDNERLEELKNFLLID